MVGYLDEESSIVNYVNQLLEQAILLGASDIHLEPQADQLRVRFRIDGMLYDRDPVDKDHMARVLSRIKVIASLDIAQRRVPQDGSFYFPINNRLVDLRVSTFPSFFGEKIVIRILDTAQAVVQLNQLGFLQEQYQQMQQLLQKASGFIIVTGPTGSGKTTTLYAALAQLNHPTKNIITLEDPVEYHVHGVTQGQINAHSGFTFARGIRSLLRQDPDIAMIGEIRDKESARIAIEASLTGHLVLSTLHTNDAPSAIIRLMDMGIESFLINASVTGVLAQRLVRTICEHCREPKKLQAADRSLMKRHNIESSNLFIGRGCSQCADIGYKGRTGIFELLVMNDPLREFIVENPKFVDIYQQALAQGMQTLKQHAARHVANGVTTLEELVRAIG